jgi:hypothetical protein
MNHTWPGLAKVGFLEFSKSFQLPVPNTFYMVCSFFKKIKKNRYVSWTVAIVIST